MSSPIPSPSGRRRCSVTAQCGGDFDSASRWQEFSSPVFSGRDFFGPSRVTSVNATGMHVLYSGSIVHNEQMVSGPNRDDPLTYYTTPVSYTHLRAHETGRNLV